MKRILVYTLAYTLLFLVFFPCVLTFTQGENNEPTIWNLVGLLYSISLVLILKKLAK